MSHAALWELYQQTGDLSARDTLIQESLGLVNHLARKIRASLSNSPPLEELISSGNIGLMQAVAAYDPERGFAFSTFAAARIRGAILDDLRVRDPLSRSARRKSKLLSSAERAAEIRLARAPTSAELAREAGIEIHDLWEWKQQLEFDTSISLDDREPGLPSIADRIGIPADAEELFEREERVARVREALQMLTPQERTVLTLFYLEEMKVNQIAPILEVTESRISQIRTAAIRKLQDRLHSTPADL
jgi:RNA polymerase sigma factor FliA